MSGKKFWWCESAETHKGNSPTVERGERVVLSTSPRLALLDLLSPPHISVYPHNRINFVFSVTHCLVHFVTSSSYFCDDNESRCECRPIDTIQRSYGVEGPTKGVCNWLFKTVARSLHFDSLESLKYWAWIETKLWPFSPLSFRRILRDTSTPG